VSVDPAIPAASARPFAAAALPWQRTAHAAGLLGADGRPAPNVFTEMTALAQRTGAINLGQGFPDTDGPQVVLEAARSAILAGANQYPPGLGVPALREAIARHQHRFHGITVDPDREVLVTTGATEALAATLLALVRPGDEVVTLDPTYDAYTALIALAGGRHVRVPLAPPDFRLPLDRLATAVTDRTAVILVNNPHNPTGTVLTRAELAAIVAAAEQHDAIVVVDEVYEHLVFDGMRHTTIAAIPGAAERSVTISSAGKTFSLTGWKIGWLVAPQPLRDAVFTVKQYLTFATGAPLQPAIAEGLDQPDALFVGVRDRLQHGRDLLAAGLARAGFAFAPALATYFQAVDAAPLGVADAARLARELPERVGVVGIPLSAFAAPEHADLYRSWLRFAFCKRDTVLQEASDRLARLAMCD
jgi:N-succinyldiaminopimelate aminotransferase